MTEPDLEAYKILKAESAAYNDKLQVLWLQKLTLSGAVVVAVFLKESRFVQFALSDLLLAATALILVLALTIDVKVLEYALHLRAISRFLERRLPPGSLAAEWEGILWGDAPAPERPLVLWRSALTILSAAVPTLAVWAMATGLFVQRIGLASALLGTGVIAVGYLGTLAAVAWSLFVRLRRKDGPVADRVPGRGD